MSEKQMVWHAYHAGTLCQLVDLKARQAQIEKIKLEHELPTRRRLMAPVIGQLPLEFITACEKAEAAQRAWEATHKAWEVQEAAWATQNAAWEVAHYSLAIQVAAWKAAQKAAQKAWEEAQETWEAVQKSREAAQKAWEAQNESYKTHKVEIEHLHTTECPGCPWDGETIFPHDIRWG